MGSALDPQGGERGPVLQHPVHHEKDKCFTKEKTQKNVFLDVFESFSPPKTNKTGVYMFLATC